MVRTIVELNKLIKEGKQEEMTKEEWEAIEQLVQAVLVLIGPIYKAIEEAAEIIVDFIAELTANLEMED